MSTDTELRAPARQTAPAKLLLVDDEPFNLDLLEQEMESQQYAITTAANGQEALDKVADDPPDMIFLDLMMPVMDGFEVLKRLAADEVWRLIPVVIISASDDLDSIVKGIELGAVDFLPKPFEPAILHARLRAGLEKKRLADLEAMYLHSLERELEIGREIQSGFLPAEIPQPPGWQLSAYFKAAREVAGDFYDVFELASGELCLLLGDVTDKGVGSALFMALYRSLLRATLMANQLVPEPSLAATEISRDEHQRAVTLVNRYICRFHPSGMLATLFLGILDTEGGRLRYVSAGHDPSFVVRDGKVVTSIDPTGPVLGAIEEAVFDVAEIDLEPADALVLYSDGIPDSRNAQGDTFGRESFIQALTGEFGSGAELAGAVLLALREFIGEADPYDDVSLLVLRRKGE